LIKRAVDSGPHVELESERDNCRKHAFALSASVWLTLQECVQEVVESGRSADGSRPATDVIVADAEVDVPPVGDLAAPPRKNIGPVFAVRELIEIPSGPLRATLAHLGQ